MIKIISAVSQNGIIGKDNGLPFHYPEDMKWFKQNTTDNVVIMGRKTFESIGKPLPKRENIVITSKEADREFKNGFRFFTSIDKFFSYERMIMRDHSVDYWFIGGAAIYQEALNLAEEIYLTLTPDVVTGDNLVRFPFINPALFQLKSIAPLSECSDLKLATYYKI